MKRPEANTEEFGLRLPAVMALGGIGLCNSWGCSVSDRKYIRASNAKTRTPLDGRS